MQCKSFNGMQDKVMFLELPPGAYWVFTCKQTRMVRAFGIYFLDEVQRTYVGGPIYDGLITDHTGKYDIARCLTSDQRYMDCCQISIVFDVPVVPYLNHRVLLYCKHPLILLILIW